ncbi:histidine kinase [Maribellus sp. CM-23]|uniref:sensor histidine kinase n=1 Tax=Maribellus sp. CM-23 TaxID=2781026 RepID=UPI001F259274|nr:histidine kinase [Maribellus sp. CM-23]MCE4567090.1 histidine kinase [Maribellus sp. CM-23]
MKYWIILFFAFAFLSTSASAQKDLTKKEVKDIVEKYFVTKEVPTRYYSNILIRLDGNLTSGDSAFVQQLIDSLNLYIDKWEVYLIQEGTCNLILEINKPDSEAYPRVRLGNHNNQEIILTTQPINIPEGVKAEERNQILYYHVIRSLVNYSQTPELMTKLPLSVFTVTTPENVVVDNFVDFHVIREVYSAKYDEKLKTSRSKKVVDKRKIPLNPAKLKYATSIALLTNILSILITTLFFIFLLNRGVFKRHNYVFWEYFKQGCWVLFTALLYLSLNLFLSYLIPNSSIITTLYAALSKELIKVLLIFAAVSFASIVIIYFAEKKILEDNKSLVVSILFPFVTTLLVPTTLILILFLLFVETDKSKNPFDVVTILLSTKTVFILIAIFRVFFIFFNRKSESIINQKDVELARMSEMHRKAELQSLRAKINPHFLYNSLNSIASLASIDPKKTEQMALSLSDFFKYSINREQKQTNPLSDELKAVETYLNIEKVRFGERLAYSLECPEELKSVQIPQLLIQPLVENAVKHGVSKLLENGEVRIVVFELEFNKISIRVYDNGPSFPDGPMSGFGIRNTHERLQLIYGSKASINWQNDPEKYIEFVLPKHLA